MLTEPEYFSGRGQGAGDFSEPISRFWFAEESGTMTTLSY